MDKNFKTINVNKKEFKKIIEEISDNETLRLHSICGKLINFNSQLSENVFENVEVLEKVQKLTLEITELKFNVCKRVASEFQACMTWINNVNVLFLDLLFKDIERRIDFISDNHQHVNDQNNNLRNGMDHFFKIIKQAKILYVPFFSVFEKIKLNCDKLGIKEKEFVHSLGIFNISTYKSAFIILTYRLRKDKYFLETFPKFKNINFEKINKNDREKKQLFDLLLEYYDLFYDSYKKFNAKHRRVRL